MANFENAEPINQFQSMYDMVKRRSNKEREKEDLIREMENRAKSLNQLAKVCSKVLEYTPRAGSGVVRIDPLRFPAGCRTRRLNQALSVLSLSLGFF